MSDEHTPGPWGTASVTLTNEGGSSDPYWPISGNGGKVIAAAYSEPDARLMATAPDLLAALERLDEHFTYYPDHAVDDRCKDIARAAIAKARGAYMKASAS